MTAAPSVRPPAGPSLRIDFIEVKSPWFNVNRTGVDVTPVQLYSMFGCQRGYRWGHESLPAGWLINDEGNLDFFSLPVPVESKRVSVQQQLFPSFLPSSEVVFDSRLAS